MTDMMANPTFCFNTLFRLSRVHENSRKFIKATRFRRAALTNRSLPYLTLPYLTDPSTFEPFSSSSLMFVIITSVVSMRPAIEAAF